jgi:recombination protein RecT
VSVAGLKQATSGESSIMKREAFPALIEKMKSQLALALPRHLSADRMARIAVTEFRKNPGLAKCDPMSVVAAVVIAAQLGLEPGVMGQAYLVPYGNNCTLIPGWQGYVDLVSRAGRASVWTGAVHTGDSFSYRYGSSPSIEHEPSSNSDDDSEFTYVYAVGRIKGAEWPVIEVWSRSKVDKHLKRYNKVGQSHYAKQNENNFAMYGRKVALLQVLKYMPKSVELQMAAGLDSAADAGAQKITIDEAVSGTFTPNGYDVEGETAETVEQRIQKLFDELDVPGDIRADELADHKDKLGVLESKLRAELEKK